ncbi:MAG: hypothetical protein WC511_03000 [Candidatus Pacearchaeota archaeon]
MSNNVPTLNEEARIGEDYRLSFKFLNPNGTPAVLSGSSIQSIFRYQDSSGDTEAFPLTTVINFTTGEIQLSLPHTTTVNMREAVGEYDVVLIDSLGIKEVILHVTLSMQWSVTLSPVPTPV